MFSTVSASCRGSHHSPFPRYNQRVSDVNGGGARVTSEHQARPQFYRENGRAPVQTLEEACEYFTGCATARDAAERAVTH